MIGLGNRKAQHSFASIPSVNMARSSFDRSHTVKDTFDFDQLVPIFIDDIIPGDTMNLTTHAFARLSTNALKVPIMDVMHMDFFFFFVPYRLVWSNWEKFNGAQDNPGDSTDFQIPTVSITAGTPTGTLTDKFGLPTEIANSYPVSALPYRAYNLIWNQWFRDQNMQNSVTVNTGNGPDSLATYSLLKRGKRHDYFTSALPWPQKGVAVTLPLGTSAPVLINNSTNLSLARNPATNAVVINQTSFTTNGTGQIGLQPANVGFKYDPNGTLYADLSAATAATINQLRQSMQIQSLYELDARGGTRYVEILLAHFNVTSPDFRLQRAEYLGGGSIVLNSNPVAQTAPTSGSNYQGQLAAFGTGSTQGKNIGFTKSFVEHGIVIGLASARADITYQNGVDKYWSKAFRYEFFWPKLQEIGEQAITGREIFCNGTTDISTIFGYQERYAEYRYKQSQIKGQFRTNYANSLDKWHLAQNFGSMPSLGDTFIQSTTPIDRALAVASTGAQIIFDCFHQIKHARPMLTYSVPASFGRF